MWNWFWKKNFYRDASKYIDISNKLEILLFCTYFYSEIKKICVYVCARAHVCVCGYVCGRVYVCVEKRDRQRNIDKTISNQCSHGNVKLV